MPYFHISMQKERIRYYFRDATCLGHPLYLHLSLQAHPNTEPTTLRWHGCTPL